jgi:phosphoglycerate dehydrogenase-like enzyme
MASSVVNVLVMAPHLGADLSYVAQVDPRIQVLDGNRAFAAELIEQNQVPGPLPPDAVPRAQRDELLATAEVLLIGYPVPRRLANRAVALRWAHHTQAGVSNLLGSDLWSSQVALTSSRGAVGVTAIAEYVLAGVLYFSRGLDIAAGRHAGDALNRRSYHLSSVAGATMGIIGLGGIGREVARLARAMGMRVVATRRSALAAQNNVDGADLLLPSSGLIELAAQSDFVVVCSQLTEQTRGMIDARVLAAMKRGSVLINIARGEEVDESALMEAINSGQLRGALLDVHEGESTGRAPRPDLLDAPTVLFTPHISTSADRTGTEPVKRLFADNLRRFLSCEPLLNPVDRARGY